MFLHTARTSLGNNLKTKEVAESGILCVINQGNIPNNLDSRNSWIQ